MVRAGASAPLAVSVPLTRASTGRPARDGAAAVRVALAVAVFAVAVAPRFALAVAAARPLPPAPPFGGAELPGFSVEKASGLKSTRFALSW